MNFPPVTALLLVILTHGHSAQGHAPLLKAASTDALQEKNVLSSTFDAVREFESSGRRLSWSGGKEEDAVMPAYFKYKCVAGDSGSLLNTVGGVGACKYNML